MTELSDHYMRVRDYARKFSLDESTVYKMIERGEIKAIRIGKKTLRIPSSELERYLEREPAAEPDAAALTSESRRSARRAAGTPAPSSRPGAGGRSRTPPRTPRSRLRPSRCAPPSLASTSPRSHCFDARHACQHIRWLGEEWLDPAELVCRRPGG